jgi:hypothetical protein
MRGALALLVLFGCASDPAETVPTGFVPLVQGDWSMPPGEEGYYCVRATIPEDMYVRAFRPIAPLGTHHTALGFALSAGDDGGFPCQASDAGFKLLFGSGVGTEAFTLPDGVAFKLPAGEQVMLNLHLYNTSDAPISGTSGIEIERIAKADALHEAETLYALNFDLSVPPGTSKTTGACSIDADSTIVGVFPHMHKLGTHMRATAAGAVLHDLPYTFEEQLDYAVPSVQVTKGTKIEYECSYQNPGTTTVEFGDSTDAEMCVLGVYRYPATGTVSLCIQ